jgi:hypothetical protein
MRKPEEDVTAREAVETLIADTISGPDIVGDVRATAKEIVGEFRYAERETTTTKVAGEVVALERYVLTTDWTVNPARG